ncbi:hypothetical protein SAMN05216268_1119 [Streptomyces yunnanensis]|uniref:Uncharacterized protein n=1 Tax=Streptomyces yunnanensis TaxID=156453 RepID=A0A9X8MZK2_9ACTN|nr:hypothetical protein SAMN05216268_1119 [Streptomyces yunnanensis]
MARLAGAQADFITGCLAWREGIPPADTHAYLSSRRATVAQRIDHLFTETSLNTEIPPDQLAHPLLQHLLVLDVDRTILIQDLLSAPKELADGETENLLVVLAAEHHCTPAQALPLALNLYEQTMDTYDDAHHQLLLTPLGHDPVIRAYLDGLNDFNTGLIEWTTNSPRYTRDLRNRWTAPDEIIHSVDEQPVTP